MSNAIRVATVLTACGIETIVYCYLQTIICLVATVLTACGIETSKDTWQSVDQGWLQQYLPLAVLKLEMMSFSIGTITVSCNSTYRLRY